MRFFTLGLLALGSMANAASPAPIAYVCKAPGQGQVSANTLLLLINGQGASVKAPRAVGYTTLARDSRYDEKTASGGVSEVGYKTLEEGGAVTDEFHWIGHIHVSRGMPFAAQNGTLGVHYFNQSYGNWHREYACRPLK